MINSLFGKSVRQICASFNMVKDAIQKKKKVKGCLKLPGLV